MSASNLGKNIASLGSRLATAEGPQIRMIDVDLIDAEEQVRTEFDDEALQELADDITARGVQQPVKVRPKEGGRFLLVFGERRLRASRLAKKKHIPAIVEDMDDEAAEDVQFTENIQRAELSLADESAYIARRYDKLQARGEAAPLDAICAQVKKSKAWVSKRLSVGKKLSGLLWLFDYTQDVEILLALDQLYKIDYTEFGKQADALKKGKATRESVRAAVAKAKEAKAAKKKAAKATKKGGSSSEPAERPFSVRDALIDCMDAKDPPEATAARWTDDNRAAVAERLREHWEAGREDAGKGPGGMVPALMRWYFSAEEYESLAVDFRAYLAGAAGDTFDLVAILTSTHQAETGRA